MLGKSVGDAPARLYRTAATAMALASETYSGLQFLCLVISDKKYTHNRFPSGIRRIADSSTINFRLAGQEEEVEAEEGHTQEPRNRVFKHDSRTQTPNVD